MNRQLKAKILVVCLILILFLGGFSLGYFIARAIDITDITEAWVNPPFTTVSYQVGVYNSTFFYGKNCTTGNYDWLNTNAGTIINNAFNALTHGGIVQVLGTVDTSTTTIVMQYGGHKLIGESVGLDTPASKIEYSGTGTAIQIKKSGGASLYGYAVEDICVDSGANGDIGIELYNCHWGKVFNVWLHYADIGIKVNGAWETEIDHCVFRWQDEICVLLDGFSGASANHVLLGFNYIHPENNGIGVEIRDAIGNPIGITLFENDFGFNNHTVGVHVKFMVRKLSMEHNYLEEGLGLINCTHIYLRGNSSKTMESVTIEDNEFALNSNTALMIDYAVDVDIKNNWLYGYAGETPVYINMTANAQNVTCRATTYGSGSVAFSNDLTAEMIWQDFEYTKAVIYIPVLSEWLNVTETSYTYKYYMFKFDKSAFERITEIKLECALKSGSGETVNLTLVVNDGGWSNVTNAWISDNTNSWLLKETIDIKDNLPTSEKEFMIQVKTTGGWSEINRVALKVKLG